jgi:hypothetical protein
MITLTLQADIVEEILNNLRDGMGILINTEEYLASGSIVGPCVIAECSNIKKVRRMMRLYEGAISTMEKAVK